MGSINTNDNKEYTVKFWPVFAGSTLSALLDCAGVFMDETITGQLFDDAAFSAVNLIEPCFSVVNFMSYLICVGGCALIVRSHGERDTKKMSDIFSHCLTSCLIISVFFFTVFALFDRPIIGFVSDYGETYEYALTAFFWKKFHVFPTVFYAFLFSYVIYMGGALFCSAGAVLELFSNLVLSIILGKHMGIGGITLASFLASCISLCVVLLYFISPKARLRVRLGFDRKIAYQILLLGFAESAIFIAETVLEGSLNYISLHRYGTAGVAVISVAINLFEFAAYVTEGISEYESVAVNEYLGQKNYARLKKSLKTTLYAAIIEGLILSAIFYVLAPFVPVLFGIDDAATADAAQKSIRILALCPVFVAADRIMAVLFQYTGHIGRSVILFFIAWGLLPVLFGWGLSFVSLTLMSLGFALAATCAPAAVLLYMKLIKHETYEQTIGQQ